MKNSAIGHSWNEVRNQLFTPEEIAESDLRVARINEQIKKRITNDKNETTVHTKD